MVQEEKLGPKLFIHLFQAKAFLPRVCSKHQTLYTCLGIAASCPCYKGVSLF